MKNNKSEPISVITCLFTRKDDTRPCLQVLRQLTLAEHRRAVADGRL